MLHAQGLGRYLISGAVLLFLLIGGFAFSADVPSRTVQQEATVDLYLFWSLKCPHCLEAVPVVEQIAAEWPWVRLHSNEITGSEENRTRYRQMAEALGEEARSVPAFFLCGRMAVGFSASETPAALRQYLLQCRDQATGMDAGILDNMDLDLPFGLSMQGLSLPLTTLVIGALDAFNPCAFFVLLFLLSLLVHSGERWRMLVIGGTFVLVSGLLYFLFMAAWLNLFLYLGELLWVTRIAALAAILVALLNIKDFYYPKLGPSLSISRQHKPGLFQRMRGLLAGNRLLPLLAGTIVLAVVANSYELLCTSGLPMVYTRILSLNELDGGSYYLYLLLYNLIYIAPLLLIVLLFTYTLGSRKLQALEGGFLKLLSGFMMLGLGLMLLLAPQWLQSFSSSLGVILLSLLLAFLLSRLKSS